MDPSRAGVTDLLDELEGTVKAKPKEKPKPEAEAGDLDIRW